MSFPHDVGLVLTYQVRRLLRTPFLIALGLVQPLLWLLLFGPLLDGISAPGLPEGSTFDQFAPGLLVMLALFGSLYAGFEMVPDLRGGVLERQLVTRMRPTALILGKVLRDVIILLVEAAILLGIAAAMGLRVDPYGLAITLALFVLVVMFTAAISYALAATLRDENVMSQTLGFLSLPLLLLSGIILPLVLAPGWLRTVAQANPFYHVVEASRSLLAGNLSDGSVTIAFVFVAVLTLLAFRWSTATLREP